MCAGLRGEVDALRDASVEQLSVEELGGDLIELHRLQAFLDAEINRRIARFDHGRGWAHSGAVDMVAWLRTECHLSPATAADRVRVARAAATHPELRTAMESGSMSHQHAAVIARAAEDAGPRADSLMPVLLDVAGHTDPASLRFRAKELQNVVDPQGMLADTNRDHSRRFLHLGARLDGLFALDGLLDTEGGRRLETALQAVMGPPRVDEPATPAQRRADALVELATRQLTGNGSGLPHVGGERPHIALAATVETLQGHVDAPAAKLDHLFPVPAASARRLACDAAVTSTVVDGSGTPLDVGRKVRTVPPSLRRAAALRDKHCRFPGCTRPADWCDGHHLKHWIDGGETKLSNIYLFCTRHHRLLHEGGWSIEVQPDGHLTAIGPQGQRRSAGSLTQPVPPRSLSPPRIA